jgi:hypothetical protein
MNAKLTWVLLIAVGVLGAAVYGGLALATPVVGVTTTG